MELIGKRIILDDDSPHSGELVEIVEIDGEVAVAKPVNGGAGFSKVLIPLSELEPPDSVLDAQIL